MSAWVIIVAAGAGERIGDTEGIPKAFLPLRGTPMFMYAVEAAQRCDRVDGIVVLVPANWIGHAAEHAGGHKGRLVIDLRAGGSTRQESVRLGLQVVPDDVEHVIVHDAARPLVSPEQFAVALDGVRAADAAVCALPSTDTLKRVKEQVVLETVDREAYWRAQTPQAFRAAVLRSAHRRAAEEGWSATDDAALVEQAGGTVVVVPGHARNIKVTTRDDLLVAEAMLGEGA